jgi:hypothetical protein
MAQEDKVKEDGRVWKITNIEVATSYKHPGYEDILYRSSGQITKTAEWTLFDIRRGDGTHLFRGRWDERKSALDIDKVKPNGKRLKNFPGHHTNQPDPALRKFDIDICFHLRG